MLVCKPIVILVSNVGMIVVFWQIYAMWDGVIWIHLQEHTECCFLMLSGDFLVTLEVEELELT